MKSAMNASVTDKRYTLSKRDSERALACTSLLSQGKHSLTNAFMMQEATEVNAFVVSSGDSTNKVVADAVCVTQTPQPSLVPSSLYLPLRCALGPKDLLQRPVQAAPGIHALLLLPPGAAPPQL